MNSAGLIKCPLVTAITYIYLKYQPKISQHFSIRSYIDEEADKVIYGLDV